VDRLVAEVPEDAPLTAVIHTAGVLADDTLTGITRDRLRVVFAPKVDGAWNLHAATEQLDLAAFVLFSSAVATLGNPGQGSYGAANAELDAFAAWRRSAGLPAISLGWGHWVGVGGMAAGLDSRQTERLARTGLRPMPVELGLELFDLAWELPDPAVLPAPLSASVLGGSAGELGTTAGGRAEGGRSAGKASAEAHAGRDPINGPATVPATGPAVGGQPGSALRATLAALPEPARPGHLLDLVRSLAAAVLGHGGPAAIDPDRGFMDAEFDSLGVIELRNRVNAVTGLRLPTSALFDYATPRTLARHIAELLVTVADQRTVPTSDTTVDELEAPWRELAAVGGEARANAIARLRDLLDELDDRTAEELDLSTQISSATDDEIYDFIDRELGIS
jgi:acyl carrier protein